MAEGITLRFQRDEADRPLVLFVRDVLLMCPVCGRERIERFYDQALYHPLDAARFAALVAEGADDVAGPCEQCGEALDTRHASRWVVTYGFPARSGVLQGFATPSETVFALAPYRRFDAQMQPELTIEDDQSIVRLRALEEDDVERVLGRPLSLKARIRALALERIALGGQIPWSGTIGADVALLVGPPGAADAALASFLVETGGPDAKDDWVWVDLGDPVTALLDAPPIRWLGPRVSAALETGALRVWAGASLSAAKSRLEALLTALPGEVPLTRDPDGTLRATFPMGSEAAVEAVFPTRRLLAEAVATGTMPGDRIALWLDEVIASLLGET